MLLFMIMSNRKTQRVTRGSALLYVLATVTMAGVLFTGLIQFVVSHVHYDRQLEPDVQALHIAEAGVYFYRWYLAHNIEGLTQSQVQAFWDGDPLGVDDNRNGHCDDPDTADGDGDGTEAYVAQYEGIGTYRICITPPSTYSTVLWISATGTVMAGEKEHTHTVRARLRKESWSEYAILANADMRLSEDTVVYGKMHVNGGFQFDGVAHNVVSSAQSQYRYPDNTVPRNDPANACRRILGVWWCKGVWTNWTNEYNALNGVHVFPAGKNFPIVAKDFNNISGDFAVIKEEAERQDLLFGSQQEGRLIELGHPSPGQMTISTVKKVDDSTFDILELSPSGAIVKDIPGEGVLFVGDDVWVEGAVPSGTSLTIASQSPSSADKHNARIILGRDDLIYEKYDGSSVLGLIADGNIELVQYSEGDINAPPGSDAETLRIDAALLSQNGRVGRQHWADDKKDTIIIYGAIATNARMGFGYTDGTGFQHRVITFDAHLLDNPPPLFPTGNTYNIDLWESQ